MPFSDAVKREAKERSHYQCAMCMTPYFLDVHHLIREADGGPNSIDNACPLCPNCHSWFGHDSAKVEAIRSKRDWHWDRCAKIDAGQMTPLSGKHFDELFQRYQVSQSQEQAKLFTEMRSFISAQFDQHAAKINIARTLPDLVFASSSASLASDRLVIPGATQCFRCKQLTQVGSQCQHCGAVSDDF